MLNLFTWLLKSSRDTFKFHLLYFNQTYTRPTATIFAIIFSPNPITFSVTTNVYSSQHARPTNFAVLVAFLSLRVLALPSPEPQAHPTTRLCQLNLTPQVGSPWADCQDKCVRDTLGNIGSAPTYTQCAEEAGCYGDCALDPPPPEALPGPNRLCVTHTSGVYTHPFQDCVLSFDFPPTSRAYTPELCTAVNGCYGECTLEDSNLALTTDEAKKQASRLCDPKTVHHGYTAREVAAPERRTTMDGV